MAVFKSLIPLLIFWIYIYGTTSDPCHEESHTIINNLGSRNAQCLVKDIPLHQRLCDHYLGPAWYKTENAVIRTKAPVGGNCGADSAAWPKDVLPTESDGVRNKTMCIRVGSNDCEEEFKIEIKKCSQFFVYNLQPFPNTFDCPAAYCFDSSLPCTQSDPISTASSTTKQPTESTNTDDNPITLTVCLAVILPVVLLSPIVGLVIWKRNTILTWVNNYVHCTNKTGDYQDDRNMAIQNSGAANNTNIAENGTTNLHHILMQEHLTNLQLQREIEHGSE